MIGCGLGGLANRRTSCSGVMSSIISSSSSVNGESDRIISGVGGHLPGESTVGERVRGTEVVGRGNDIGELLEGGYRVVRLSMIILRQLHEAKI